MRSHVACVSGPQEDPFARRDTQPDLGFRGPLEVPEECASRLFSAVSAAPRPPSSFGAGQMWPANGHRAAVSREGTWRWLCGQGSACRTRLSACPLLGRSIARPSGQVAALAPPPARCPLRQTPGLWLPCPRPGAQGDPLRVSCALTLVTTSGQGPGADGL